MNPTTGNFVAIWTAQACFVLSQASVCAAPQVGPREAVEAWRSALERRDSKRVGEMAHATLVTADGKGRDQYLAALRRDFSSIQQHKLRYLDTSIDDGPAGQATAKFLQVYDCVYKQPSSPPLGWGSHSVKMVTLRLRQENTGRWQVVSEQSVPDEAYDRAHPTGLYADKSGFLRVALRLTGRSASGVLGSGQANALNPGSGVPLRWDQADFRGTLWDNTVAFVWGPSSGGHRGSGKLELRGSTLVWKNRETYHDNTALWGLPREGESNVLTKYWSTADTNDPT
jgi:ketosteroid isomerase-like protein